MGQRESRRSGGGDAVGARVERVEERRLLSAVFADGTANAMAYDASGRLWVAYYDTAEKNLKYGLRNADGTWASLANAVIDEGTVPPDKDPALADVGQMVTMVIERGGRPGVAYYDAYNADLKYAYYNGASWDVSVVESYRTTGYYPSIAFNPGTNRPAIAYHYATNGDLRLRQFNGSNWGGDADYQWVDGQGDNVGRFCVLALDRAGRWAVGYDDSTNGAAKYAFQGSGGTWAVRMVDNVPTSDVAFTSIAFDANNRPALAYYDTNAADLKFAKGTDSTASAWTVEALATKNTAGKYTNLFYDGATNKFTVYYNLEAGGVTKINSLTGNSGSWGDAQTLYAGGGSEARVLKTPGVAGGVTFSWSAPDADGGNSLYVNDTTTGAVWRQETADAGFNGRVMNPGTAVHAFNGQERLYAIAGHVDTGGLGMLNLSGTTNLVRSSADGGVTWTSRTPTKADGTTAFGGRTRVAAASFNGRLWVIGGYYTDYLREVWSSADGVTWAREADLPAGMAARSDAASVVSADGGTLYLIGGETPDGRAGDVWATTDGVNWVQRNAAAAFGPRNRSAALWFNNRLWVLGGSQDLGGGAAADQDDAWYSADGGVTWTEATAPSGAVRFTARASHSAVVHDNRMWVLGGRNSATYNSADHTDAWYSFDGVNWTQAAVGSQFARNGAGAASVNGRLVFLFGENMAMTNDVWSAA